MPNFTVQVSANTEYLQTLKEKNKNRHKRGYYHSYYQKNKQKYLLANQKYQQKKQSFKLAKPLSSFQQKKTHQLLRILVNQRSFVPVPSKLKHPVIKNWNADNYWYSKKLDLNNLERGCVRILKDNWNNCAIIWLDIDQKGWTKLAKLLRCGYIISPKKHIRIPVPVKSLGNLKTGVLYWQNRKIGDAKLSGEVMLPNQTYYDKNGQFLGYYRYRAWGTFFPLKNKIWANPQEFFAKLTEISNIEYQTISQHFIIQKTQIINQEKPLLTQELLNMSVLKPPWQKMIITPEMVSQNRH